MKKENFYRAAEIDDELVKLKSVKLPTGIEDVNLVRNDGIVNKWWGNINTTTKPYFKVHGGQDSGGEYSIKIDNIPLKAKEAQAIIDAIQKVINDRIEKLTKEFKEL